MVSLKFLLQGNTDYKSLSHSLCFSSPVLYQSEARKLFQADHKDQGAFLVQTCGCFGAAPNILEDSCLVLLWFYVLSKSRSFR